MRAVATPMQKTFDTNGFRRVKDAVLEDAGSKKTCLSSLVNESDVPLEPCPQGALPGPCREHGHQFPQRYTGTKADIRDLVRDAPVTPVSAKKVLHSPTFDSIVEKARVNEAESLQRSAALQQQSDRGITDAIASPNQTVIPRNLPSGAQQRQDVPQGAPCTAKPCKSSMPSVPSEMKEGASSQKQELSSVRTTSEPKQNSVGTVGKQNPGGDKIITIQYHEGEQPMSEILRLAGGQGSLVIVEAVAAGSKVAQAGVLPGYALVSMNGRTEFTQLPGWQVRLLLESPITLGFDAKPHPGPNQVGMCTEIRLKRVDEGIGVAPKVPVCGPKELGMLAEEVVFLPGSAPLFLRSGKSFSEPSPPEASNENAEGRSCNQTLKGQSNRACIYELRPRDAQIVVGRAAHGARAAIGSKVDVETVGDAGSKGSFVRSTSKSYCSSNLVAQCVDDPEHTTKGNSHTHPQTSKQFVFPENAGHRATARTNKPGASPSSSLRGKDWPRDGMKCVCGPEEDEDNWLNFHSSRSPLRWLAPVLEPVVRAFSPSRSPSRTMPPRSENSPLTSPRSRSTTLEGEFTTPHVISSPVLGNSATRRRKEDKITPISRDLSPFRHREKGLSGAMRDPSPKCIQPGGGGTRVSSRSTLGGPVRDVHSLSGPRSPSPMSRVPAGDTCADVYDYNENARAGRRVDTVVSAHGLSSSRTEPSFSVSWNNDMLPAVQPLVTLQ